MPGPLVVIPTYNERENLPAIVARVRAAVPEASVLVVDDHSPDGTGELADGLAHVDPSVHVLHRRGKEGLGAAYLSAFEWALERGHDPVVQLDADGSHLPEELPRLLAALETPDAAGRRPDLVIGSRWVPGGSVVNWPRHRMWLSRVGSAYSRIMLDLPVRDATGGYRVFRAEGLRRLHREDVHTRGYGFQVDMLWHAVMHGLSVVEVPITFVERELGRSKMSWGIVIEAIWQVTAWGFTRRFGRRRDQAAAATSEARRRSRA
ncbi:polyprenol monophosphomannose synthase [Agromyces aurantiacus]|uniref:Polyprenol monophosphomannose synthase n=1 Tax=Agromyces aurantiacus TaxID=165814 RepID=A0ABV9R7V5_9MICO|nr:polyprenol monophosphomannose synthase [Agromyces aurantiacus]MBM7503123.1 glycosyltransferase involved in cell wall biosynthesis [Agromyces aurantiacus]